MLPLSPSSNEVGDDLKRFFWLTEHSKSREREQQLQARVDLLEHLKREEVCPCSGACACAHTHTVHSAPQTLPLGNASPRRRKDSMHPNPPHSNPPQSTPIHLNPPHHPAPPQFTPIHPTPPKSVLIHPNPRANYYMILLFVLYSCILPFNRARRVKHGRAARCPSTP